MLDTVFNEDCIEGIKKIPDGSVSLVLTDPPYNVNIAEWDHWNSVDDYVNWCGEWIKEIERVLSSTGTFIFFHNDIEQISRIMEWIRVNTCLSFNSFCIWDKGDFRALSWKNPSEENNLRCWFNTCEYFLVYVKNDTEWGVDKTGLQRVKLDVNNFAPLRKYAHEMLIYIGEKYSISPTTGAIERESSDIEKRNIFSIAGRRSIFDEVGGKGDHFTRYGSTQWELCTEDTYKELTDKFNLKEWDGYREYESLRQEYESLRQEYESLRYVHNLDANHKNIFTSRQRNSGALHPTEKPTDILTRLIKVHSRKGDTVLDLFCGSFSTIISSMNAGRHFIGFELDKYYYEWGIDRIKKFLASRGVKSVEEWYKKI